MKKIRLRLIAIFSLAALLGGALLYTSQKVQYAEDKVAGLHAQIAQQEEEIRVLKAEWAYLNSPSRLENLARDYTNLGPAEAQRIRSDVPVPEGVGPQDGLDLSPKVEAQSVGLSPSSGVSVTQSVSREIAVPARKPVPLQPAKTNDSAGAPRDFSSMLERIKKGGAQ